MFILYCKFCGSPVKDNDSFCTNCGSQIIKSNQSNDIVFQDNKRANKLCLLSLFWLFIFPAYTALLSVFLEKGGDFFSIIYSLHEAISAISPFIALILMVYVRVKYPKNTFGKVLMWLYIVLFIILLIAFVYLIIGCIQTCERGFA